MGRHHMTLVTIMSSHVTSHTNCHTIICVMLLSVAGPGHSRVTLVHTSLTPGGWSNWAESECLFTLILTLLLFFQLSFYIKLTSIFMSLQNMTVTRCSAKITCFNAFESKAL